MHGHRIRRVNNGRLIRAIKVAPITGAIRAALAASATLLALAGSGVAFAGTCAPAAANTVSCNGDFTETVPGTLFAPAVDLTLILGDVLPTNVIPAAGNIGVNAAWGGNVGVVSHADITTVGADGIRVSGATSASVSNSGDITTHVTAVGANAMDISALYDVTVVNSGNIFASSSGTQNVTALFARSNKGNVSIDNQATGTIAAFARSGNAFGVQASAFDSLDINNDGEIYASSLTGRAYGISAMTEFGDGNVINAGSITAAGRWATGIFADTESGILAVANTETGIIRASGVQSAIGIAVPANGDAYSSAINNAGSITALTSGDCGCTEVRTIGIDAGGWVFPSKHKYSDSSTNTTVANSGSIVVSSDAKSTVANRAIGIQAYSKYGVASVDNSGGITVHGDGDGKSYRAFGIYATTKYGGASVVNSGDISVEAGATPIWDSASGIWATSTKYNNVGGVNVDNSGTVSASSWAATGISVYATFDGNATVNNSGDISAHGFGDSTVYRRRIYTSSANGIYAVSTLGDLTLTNSGSITVDSNGRAFGINAGARRGGTSIIDNSGSITATASTAVGIYSISQWGDDIEASQIINSGDISASADFLAYGMRVRIGYSDVAITNSGSINASISAGSEALPGQGLVGGNGQFAATGVWAYNIFDDISLRNSGSILAEASSNGSLAGSALGVFSLNGYGDVSINNTGSITALTDSGHAGSATGIFSVNYYGDVDVTNAGMIAAGVVSDGLGYDVATAAGVLVFGVGTTGELGDITVTNSSPGSITVSAESASGSATATGISAAAYVGSLYYGNGVAVDNAGMVSALAVTGDAGPSGTAAAQGISALGGREGTVDVSNTGMISATATTGAGGSYASAVAHGIIAQSGYADVSVHNVGRLAVSAVSGAASSDSWADAYGVAAVNYDGAISIDNSGRIDVTASSGAGSLTSYATATGVSALISAGGYGAIDVANSGMIRAAAQDSAIGLQALSYGGDGFGTITITNSGLIEATGNADAYGIVASTFGDGNVTIDNAGTISASADADGMVVAVSMQSIYGTSTLDNASTGWIHVDGDAGSAWAVKGSDAVDTITNAGRITGSIYLYGGDDVINNLAGGTIRLEDATIHLGSSIGSNAFNNAGTIKVLGASLIDMGSGSEVALVPALNALPLVNNGVIDFLDGHPDDSLIIVGDLGGTGSVNIDVDLSGLASDQLYVEGSMVSGAVQTVNVALEGIPGAAHTSIDFAHVTGNSVAGSFVPGQLLGYNQPRNFLDLRFSIGSAIDASNATADVFSVDLDVAGLNDPGTLAASVASGAADMLNSQIGTFKQRMGVNPYGDAGKVMSAFFRTYTSKGDVSPAHVAGNFGQGGNFDYDLSVWGREVGVNANLFGNFHAGVVLGSADGRQRLTGAGVGSNRMDGMTWGAYATWFAPQGFYVDLSGRWMAVDVRSLSAAGQMETRAHTAAWNLEAGYQWMLGGLSVVPQVQYTRTEVQDVRPLQGDLASFAGHGGTSTRGRLGVGVSKTFQSGNVRWTPYGSINAIREFDGDMTYTVADTFVGNTSTQGTSSMAELGLGMQAGGWGFTIGANWQDGGALHSIVGGQLGLRYSW